MQFTYKIKRNPMPKFPKALFVDNAELRENYLLSCVLLLGSLEVNLVLINCTSSMLGNVNST